MSMKIKLMRNPGFWYVMVVLFGVFAEIGHSRLNLSKNIMAVISEAKLTGLHYCLSFMSDFFIVAAFVLFPLVLYWFLVRVLIKKESMYE